MAEKTSRLLQIRVTPTFLKKLRKRRVIEDLTMKEMVTRALTAYIAAKPS